MTTAKLTDIEFDMLTLRNAERVQAMVFDELVAGIDRDNVLVRIVRRACPELSDREVLVLSEDEFNALLYSVFHLSDLVKNLYAKYHRLIDGGADCEGEPADASS